MLIETTRRLQGREQLTASQTTSSRNDSIWIATSIASPSQPVACQSAKPPTMNTQGVTNRSKHTPIDDRRLEESTAYVNHAEGFPAEPKPSMTLGKHNESSATPGRSNSLKVRKEGESGRNGIHPLHFLKIIWNSSCKANKWVNVLWPFVPTALALVKHDPSVIELL